MSVKDYPSMLRFIAIGSSVVMLICFAILYNNSEWIRGVLENVPSYEVEIKQIPINTSYLIPVVGWFFFSYFTKFHDRLSDLFKIRKNFDFQYILIPMANEVGIALKSEERENLQEKRKILMGKVFYKYADSTSPKISQHNIIEALTNWAVYWFLLESIFILLIFLIPLLFMGLFGYALFISLWLILFIFISDFFYKESIEKVNTEIKLIFEIDEGQVYHDIEEEFKNAL